MTSSHSPPSATTSYNVTTFGWFTFARILPSARSRLIRSAPCSLSRETACLIATSRPSSSSTARQTVPPPPEPICSANRYRPLIN
ncbi:hypothetical protein SAMN05216215_102972 [Saccharopolyspora shandongensis]|uniref:Uncharacterized protein n=1 Tax=Saccharopolyspora shandongensis TaxID=418495 RepID=A0A1H3KY13_9PSEU|nr:hypothetical protein [Saccharopolyspora shandongensis]SDY56970.1 hypothetical protein SAMN05216215_102972 [Saccharopolyspora shandongensis]